MVLHGHVDMQILQQIRWAHSHGSHLIVHGCLILFLLLPGIMQFWSIFTELHVFHNIIDMNDWRLCGIHIWFCLITISTCPTNLLPESHTLQWTKSLTSGISPSTPDNSTNNVFDDRIILYKVLIIVFWSLQQRPAWHVPLSLFS